MEFEKTRWDYVVIAKHDRMPLLLSAISKQPHITLNELGEFAKLGKGKVWQTLKACKTLGLVKNSFGLRLTELGHKWHNEWYKNQAVPQELLKEAYLNVPWYKEAFELKIRDHTQMKSFLKSKFEGARKNVGNTFIGSAARRYLEGVYGIKLRIGGGHHAKNTIQSKMLSQSQSAEEVLRNFIAKFKIDEDSIQSVIESLPPESKKEVYKILLTTLK